MQGKNAGLWAIIAGIRRYSALPMILNRSPCESPCSCPCAAARRLHATIVASKRLHERITESRQLLLQPLRAIARRRPLLISHLPKDNGQLTERANQERRL